MQTDPVLALLGGAAAAALIGLLGAWIQSRREHSRWIRENRLDAYQHFLRVINTNPGANPEWKRYTEYISDYRDALGRISIVGTKLAVETAETYFVAKGEYVRAMGEADGETGVIPNRRELVQNENAARDAFLAAVRRELRIRG